MSSARSNDATHRPNIIYILADDLGWRDLSCYGSTFYETPNLDRLASRGMRFTDAYAACPVCSPTRASILTGRYPAHVGLTDWIDFGGRLHPCRGRLIDAPYLNHLPESEVTTAHTLRKAGYQTWHVGKWHLGGEGSLPEQRGFDVNVGGSAWGGPGGKGYFAPWGIDGLREANVPEGTFLDEYLTDKAAELIRSHSGASPFYLNMCFYLVHTPLMAPEPLVEKYRQKAKRMRLDQVEALVAGEPHPPEHKSQWPVVRRVVQSDPVYAAMVELMDTCVGRILQAVEDAGQTDNTMVIFTSDNGGLSTSEGSPTCNFPLSEGKGWMYDGGTREPLIVSYPGVVEPGSTCSEPVTSPDFYPTLLEAAGVQPTAGHELDGVSLMPLLRREAEALDREAIYWHYPHYGNQGGTPSGAVRMRDWKLSEFFEDGRLELYNLAEDISETRNLAEVEPERAQQMHAMLKAWRQRVSARMPAINPDYVAPTAPEAHPAV